jgi:hypothetical protein
LPMALDSIIISTSVIFHIDTLFQGGMVWAF